MENPSIAPVLSFSGFICNPDGVAVDMVMTDPATQFQSLYEMVKSGKQPVTEDFMERINAYNSQ